MIKLMKKKAKSFLIQNLPENLDLDFVLENLPKKDIFDPLKLLTNVFFECGYIIAKSDGFLKSIPQFWFSLHLDENNQSARLILSSFFSSRSG